MKIQRSITDENLVSLTGIPASSLPALQIATGAFMMDATDQSIHLLQKFRETHDYNFFLTAIYQMEKVSLVAEFNHALREHNVAAIIPTT